jgi:hypothetical protein
METRKIIRNQFFLLIFILMSLSSNAQDGFKWDRIDSVPKSKKELFSQTKMFIAEKWRSANHVIQNADEEAGIIVIKATYSNTKTVMVYAATVYFNYTAIFYVKDGKCRIVVENIYSTHTTRAGSTYDVNMPIADKFPTEKGMKLTNMTKSSYEEMMKELKIDISAIVDGYSEYLRISKNAPDKW